MCANDYEQELWCIDFNRYKRGRAHGREARLKGVNVILGPAMGPLGRMPAGGRNWEGFGADPVLQGVAASETIKGIQDEAVIATGEYTCFFYSFRCLMNCTYATDGQ